MLQKKDDDGDDDGDGDREDDDDDDGLSGMVVSCRLQSIRFSLCN